MGEVVLNVNEISKIYRLGEYGSGTISEDISILWAKLRGLENPIHKIGEINDRSKKKVGNYVWALKDISFNVEKGEVLGIIGSNGAGKSTLLKIISQITSPSQGLIQAKGRIASLLEVGTGMHPEMTARENIYLNGTILGMKKSEINLKFDEILDFAGCLKYVDTPIKRFSSGMKVRLAFAVAAFLEPEILIIDEVLAVGDFDFQKKAVHKMKEISSSGDRTVLFVSHSMASVKALCSKAILLENGEIISNGSVENTVSKYLRKKQNYGFDGIVKDQDHSFSSEDVSIYYFNLFRNETNHIKYLDTLEFKICYEVFNEISNSMIDVRFHTEQGVEVAHVTNRYDLNEFFTLEKGKHEIKINIENNLHPGIYFVSVGVHKGNGKTLDFLENILSFKVLDFSSSNSVIYPFSWKVGNMKINSKWEFIS